MPHQDKYPTVKWTFELLRDGKKWNCQMAMILSLSTYKFPEDFPDQYEWNYLEQGPEV